MKLQFEFNPMPTGQKRNTPVPDICVVILQDDLNRHIQTHWARTGLGIGARG